MPDITVRTVDSEGFDAVIEKHRGNVVLVEEALADHPQADVDALLLAVYGRALPPGTGDAARMSLQALMDYVRG